MSLDWMMNFHRCFDGARILVEGGLQVLDEHDILYSFVSTPSVQVHPPKQGNVFVVCCRVEPPVGERPTLRPHIALSGQTVLVFFPSLLIVPE